MNANDQVNGVEVEATAKRKQVSAKEFLAGYLAEVQDKGVDAAGNHRATLEDVAKSLNMTVDNVYARAKELRKSLKAAGKDLPELRRSAAAHRGRAKVDMNELLEIFEIFEGE